MIAARVVLMLWLSSGLVMDLFCLFFYVGKLRCRGGVRRRVPLLAMRIAGHGEEKERDRLLFSHPMLN